MKLLNGSEVVDFIKERQAKQVRNLRQSWQTVPRLAIVQTTGVPVIATYVRLKQRYADDILVECEQRHVTSETILSTIDELNERDDVHGIIVQLPLDDPAQTDEALQRIAPEKDVDGLGRNPAFSPATPTAIGWLLASYGVELANCRIAVVGNGRLVGGPLTRMWRECGYDVTAFDEESGDLTEVLRVFDVIVTATGVPHLITSRMVKIGAVIVDAGTASEKGVIVGDVAEDVRARDDVTITPIRGGVGPLTVAALIDNVITAARRVADRQQYED